jgi:dTDP-glucose 4,6-dehydratase
MKLLVTGGLGFIGSNFILHVLKNYDDFEIINVDAELLGSNHENLTEVKNVPNYEFVKGNIINRKLMEDLISRSDAVINFAAESHVDRSIADADPFLKSNIRGTYTILDIIRNQKKRFVHISTDEVFGSIENGSAVETSNFNPSSPYAATKAAAELLVNSYFVTYGCDVVITRCTNNYGPRQHVEFDIIPKAIALIKQNKKVPIYGTGKSIRDWIYVDDHCEAVMLALQKGKSGESYNISASNEIDVLTIVKNLLTLLDKPLSNLQFGEGRPGEDLRYSLDSSKIRRDLGWKHKIDFAEGLQKTIQWYLENENRLEDLPKNTLSSTPWKDLS